MKPSRKITVSQLILIASIGLIALYNLAFFKNSFAVYPISIQNSPFIISLAFLIIAFTVLLLTLTCYRLTIKPILMFIFIASAGASYFMDSYNIVIDTAMLQNAVETTSAETRDLITLKFLLYIAILGVLPAIAISKLTIEKQTLRSATLSRAKLLGGSTVAIVAILAIFSSNYVAFFREHKSLRYYANPLTFIYSSGVFISDALDSNNSGPKQKIGLDAAIPEIDIGRELIILVVGETARADHFSLNGYERETNPRLAEKDLISFKNMRSCGTATAISVPCMFSLKNEDEFDVNNAGQYENVLDVLQHADVSVLWRDNNTGAKGLIADQFFEDFTNPNVNTICDVECRDEGMLVGLESFIRSAPGQDIVIVLHQMGNHGPAYFKRYPQEFERFTPACQTAQLEECSDEQIVNAYDNAIVYTDHFLAEVIEFLEPYDSEFETAMFYVSDHGESLGENGLYLHGLPNFMAPDTQRAVPAILWLGKNYDLSLDAISSQVLSELTHDNYYHTVLGLMEIETDTYDKDQDIVHGCCL